MQQNVDPAAAGLGHADRELTDEDMRAAVREGVDRAAPDGKRILLLVPDQTRSGPVGPVFKAIHAALDGRAKKLDVLVALGTHPPLSEAAINARLDLTPQERAAAYADVDVHNHAWDDPAALASVGTIPADVIDELSGGLFRMDVEVTVNRRLFDYDAVWILGPVFPHEVVGMSGGNKYLFPGVSGPAIIDFFHWLGAVITNVEIIGRKDTPVRRVLDRAAALLDVERRCFAMVVKGGGLAGLYTGSPEAAWSRAADLSARVHVRHHARAYHTVLSCAPAMYDDLWVGGKCMYKLEPVVADGGELVIYAPHITEVSPTHGRVIEEIGYHVRDYFRKQWDRFQHYPWGVVAHSTHVRGAGTWENGVETPRVNVTLATGIPPETCRRINLGYRDPTSIRLDDFRDREADGVLLVEKAGEILHRVGSADNHTS